MKITNLSAEIATISGTYSDSVELPDGKKGSIQFQFEFDKNHYNTYISTGTLSAGNAEVTFSRISRLSMTRRGNLPEDWDISEIIYEAIFKMQEKLKSAEFDVKIITSA